MALDTSPRLTRHDDIYQALAELHAGLSPQDALQVDARLILLLANQIGDPEVVLEAIAAARLRPMP